LIEEEEEAQRGARQVEIRECGEGEGAGGCSDAVEARGGGAGAGAGGAGVNRISMQHLVSLQVSLAAGIQYSLNRALIEP
jgi:hypothetical protein